MDVVLGVSVIASFLAGLVALAAPCCVTVVLPTYLAAALKRRSRIVAMTLVYFLGLATVLLPIILGVAWLAETLRMWHSQLYVVGGGLMFLLAGGAIAGIKLPGLMGHKGIKVDPARPSAVFLLGAFSGAATACCAPVLLGAATLSVLTGSFWQALLVSLAYVAGIVFPLLVAAVFYDRFNLAGWFQGIDKQMEIKWFGKRIIKTRLLTFISAVIFGLMGGVFLYVGLRQDGYWSPEWQVALGESLNKWSTQMTIKLEVIPNEIFGIGVIVMIGVMIWLATRVSKRRVDNIKKEEVDGGDYKNKKCH